MSGGFDHAVHLVPDLTAAKEAAESLGFTLTARGQHPRFGSANHLAVFAHDYWELLGIETAMVENEGVRQRVSRQPGLAWLALRSVDLDSEIAATRGRGIEVEEPIRFGRPLMLDGRQHEARFRVARFKMPEGIDSSFFYCHHETPQFVWRDEWLHHENGVTAILGPTFMGADVSGSAAELARAVGGSAIVASSSEALVMCGGRHQIRVTSAARLAELFPQLPARAQTGATAIPVALTFITSSLEVMRQALTQSGANFWESADERLYLVSEALGHTILEFVTSPHSGERIRHGV
jgi:hypothetical protein